MSTKRFIDDVIEHKEDDIEKIQTKPNMYISYLGSAGSLHLAKELINNGIDECINKNSPGDTIDIFLDEAENTITVSDNGRGIAPESMIVVSTKLQSGSKFDRLSSSSSAGENGVGITAANSLSEKFEIIVHIYGEKSKVQFCRGKTKDGVVTTKIKNADKHGTTFVMQPSKFFMGDDCDIIADDLIAWLDKIIYLVPSDIKINLSIKKKGKESLVTKKYSNKDGLYDYIKKLCNKPLVSPIHFIKTTKMTETFHGEKYERFLGIEAAFTYDANSVEFTTDSFCNFVNTIDGGIHVDGVRQGLVQYLGKMTRESLSERDSKKYDIIPSDVTQGLVLTVYLNTTFQPQFTGQTKEKVGNSFLFKPIRELTYAALFEYFKANPKELKKIIDRVKLNAKARVESTKLRNSVIRGEANNYEEFLMENFNPANNKGKNDYRELFLIEGKSAKGSSSEGRFDRDTQAIFALRGVPLNAFGAKLDKVLLNDEFRTLVKILGCNIGERFDINKLKYNKIIILSDSDSDGFNITSLLCAFFITHLPELVKRGYIYKAVAPLYRIKSKYKDFILNKQEYVQIFEKQIRDNILLYDINTNKPYTNLELQDLLMVNRNYFEELQRTSNHLAIHPFLLEYIAIHRHEKDFYKKFKKKYPELTIDEDNVMSGIYEGKYQILIMDKLFDKRMKEMDRYIHEINKDHMYFIVKEKNSNDLIDRGTMTLGEFLGLCNKFQPIIQARYKGLGELKPKELRDTTLDPDNRILIRLTVDDIEKDLSVFNILHGDESDERKLMMEHFRINREDLDN